MDLSGVQGESATSLEQTLDHENMKKCTEKYLTEVSNLPENHDDVIGYAFAINSQVNSADVYSSNRLFKTMWPKLIRAAAAEAFSELKEGEEFAPPTSADVQACIDDVGKAQTREFAVSGMSKTYIQESNLNVLFETRNLLNGGTWVHRNYVRK